VVAGAGTGSVLLYDCLLWRALTEAFTLERIDQRYGSRPRLGMPGPALVASLPGPLPPTMAAGPDHRVGPQIDRDG